MKDGEAVDLRLPQGEPIGLVFDSPHSGEIHPDDFGAALPVEVLRRGMDRYVDRLFGSVVAVGGTMVAARFARTYVDPNRSPLDIDLGMLDGPWPHEVRPSLKTERGIGLIWKRIGEQAAIYDRLLSPEEVERRIERCWRPYHDCLQAALDRAHARQGVVWHVSCHSMQAIGDHLAPDAGRRRADFVLGDLEGRSCDPAFTALVAETLREAGHSVALNDPYKGAELTERHGHPRHGRHSLQIEVNRGLYMDETTLEPGPGFEPLRATLETLIRRMADFVRARSAAAVR